ncbi:MAG: hypothetical protein M1823_001459 [Watsoniomyces obsoletus]|nr:MAG: hypothetical protein M1823_001459 [Watsoniomyces obsoletus]
MNIPEGTTHLTLAEQIPGQYDHAFQTGEFVPVVYPRDSFGAALLILYLLIPQQRFPLVKFAKLPVFALILWFQSSIIYRSRSKGWAAGFGVGLLSAWAIVWSATLILFTDPQKDFKRIRIRRTKTIQDCQEQEGTLDQGFTSALNGSPVPSTAHRHQQNGNVVKSPMDAKQLVGDERMGSERTQSKQDIQNQSSSISTAYYWQTYPENDFRQRLVWVLDLVTNFRGVGWNWQLPGLQGPPKDVQDQLKRDDPDLKDYPWTISRPTGHRIYYQSRDLLRRKAAVFIFSYLVLDACKVTMMKDPYFWGLVDHPPPTSVTRLLGHSIVLTRIYRLVVSMTAMVASLQGIFATGPLLFVGLLGPNVLGAQGEPWMYPDFWGGYQTVLDTGLAGWWGGWWHQSFRFAFAAPSAWVIAKLGVDRRTFPARFFQLMVAFMLSGFMHACGSHTHLPPTRPLRGPFLFFTLQPIGIVLQALLVRGMNHSGMIRLTPKPLRQLASFIYVHLWFYFTAPLLVDDFSRGGIWLFELLPWSPLRGLGLGLKEEGWWCWKTFPVHWHRGRHWWDSGLAL